MQVVQLPPAATAQNALEAIPDPVHVRWVIGLRYAEILVLKKLLRAAESRCRLFPGIKSSEAESRQVAGV